MIQSYQVIGGTDRRTLQQDVNAAIQQGWQPLGGVAVSLGQTEQGIVELYAQAMVR